MKPHQLSNGDWIDLHTVKGIRVLERATKEAAELVGTTFPDRLVIEGRAGVYDVVMCDDIEQAVQMRDELAGLVNAA